MVEETLDARSNSVSKFQKEVVQGRKRKDTQQLGVIFQRILSGCRTNTRKKRWLGRERRSMRQNTLTSSASPSHATNVRGK